MAIWVFVYMSVSDLCLCHALSLPSPVSKPDRRLLCNYIKLCLLLKWPFKGIPVFFKWKQGCLRIIRSHSPNKVRSPVCSEHSCRDSSHSWALRYLSKEARNREPFVCELVFSFHARFRSYEPFWWDFLCWIFSSRGCLGEAELTELNRCDTSADICS